MYYTYYILVMKNNTHIKILFLVVVSFLLYILYGNLFRRN